MQQENDLNFASNAFWFGLRVYIKKVKWETKSKSEVCVCGGVRMHVCVLGNVFSSLFPVID